MTLMADIILIALTDFLENNYRFAKKRDSFIFLFPNTWVRLFFKSYGRRRAMARVNHGFIGQRVHLLSDIMKELLLVPPGQMSLPYTVWTKHVSTDHEPLLCSLEAQMCRRMARKKQETKTLCANGDGFSLF